ADRGLFDDQRQIKILAINAHANRHRAQPCAGFRCKSRTRHGNWQHNRLNIEQAQRTGRQVTPRSEEHTSELQSRENLVCRLLLGPAQPASPPPSLPDALPIWLTGGCLMTSGRSKSSPSMRTPTDIALSRVPDSAAKAAPGMVIGSTIG